MHNISEWRSEPGLNQYVADCPQDVSEVLVLHQMAQAVRAEIRYREAFNRHCEWYAAIAQEHQTDLVRMRAEPQLVRGFPRYR
ncbi:MAG: hypothetical protein HC812_00885 [Leptolyngbya sp. RL_3_1]|nr:hypothetical protein [Leptolyngbya sp. RL_3_1]